MAETVKQQVAAIAAAKQHGTGCSVIFVKGVKLMLLDEHEQQPSTSEAASAAAADAEPEHSPLRVIDNSSFVLVGFDLEDVAKQCEIGDEMLRIESAREQQQQQQQLWR
jgi:hypothetical protein